MAHYHYLEKKKKISNLLMFWKYVGINHFFKTRVCEILQKV